MHNCQQPRLTELKTGTLMHGWFALHALCLSLFFAHVASLVSIHCHALPSEFTMYRPEHVSSFSMLLQLQKSMCVPGVPLIDWLSLHFTIIMGLHAPRIHSNRHARAGPRVQPWILDSSGLSGGCALQKVFCFLELELLPSLTLSLCLCWKSAAASTPCLASSIQLGT